MPNMNLKKTQKVAARKPFKPRINLRSWAQREGIPEFMVRLARKRRARIIPTAVTPKFRHD